MQLKFHLWKKKSKQKTSKREKRNKIILYALQN